MDEKFLKPRRRCCGGPCSYVLASLMSGIMTILSRFSTSSANFFALMRSCLLAQ